jgi:hypothetical protein
MTSVPIAETLRQQKFNLRKRAMPPRHGSFACFTRDSCGNSSIFQRIKGFNNEFICKSFSQFKNI